nr:MAG TPA: hypothetical protein [Caudoviricetes sp.]
MLVNIINVIPFIYILIYSFIEEIIKILEQHTRCIYLTKLC